MIAYSIGNHRSYSGQELRLGFSVWAMGPPKDYLAIYPKAAEEIKKRGAATSHRLYALIDDVWPGVVDPRTAAEQNVLSEQYRIKLVALGFSDTVLVSQFTNQKQLQTIMQYATKITVSEFRKLLPESKKVKIDSLDLGELIGFFWHVAVLEVAISRFQLTGLLAGIRSEYFYLTARKLLQAHVVHFIKTL